MHIYQAEKDDNLEHQLSSQACVTYSSMAFPYISTNELKIDRTKLSQSFASLNDNDLYYVQSILVSSNWNKNDDIFDKTEIWLARRTPEDKPTNLEHNENLIIGHITSNWPITEDGTLIPDDISIDSLPEKYHILTGSVIYRGYSSEELRNRTEKLIAEIKNGTKYVSMECLFKGFDYGLINNDTNEYKTLSRNEETAYLTKFLRAYGGSGMHGSFKVGRVLRNITFSGKGFVDRPANPESIIFNIDLFSEKNTDFTKSGVSNNQSNIIMENKIMPANTQAADNTTENTVIHLVAQNVELASALKTKEEEMKKMMQKEEEAMQKEEEAMQEEEKAMKEMKKMKEASDKSKAESDLVLAELNKSLEETKQTLVSKEEEINALRTEIESIEATMKKDTEAKDEELKTAKSELESANETLAMYKDKEAEMVKKEKKMKRQAGLIESGVDSETAAGIVDRFESVDDDSFEAMTTLFAGKMPPWLEKIKKKEDKDKKAESTDNASEELLEEVETEADVNLGVGNDSEEVDATENTRAALVDYISNRLSKSHK